MGANQNAAQIRYTTKLHGRDTVWPDITADEAHDMLTLGFRFSIVDDHTGEYRLSLPYDRPGRVGVYPGRRVVPQNYPR